jgi:large subunit ribosomal protein L10
MHKEDKGRVIAELTARLRETEALIVTDYRGLTMPQLDALRDRLIEHGGRFTVVKNTLTRRAAGEAGVEALLAMLEGPSAIAFIESGGNLVEVARALSDSARETRVLVIRGGLMQGRTIGPADVDALAKLPPFDVLRAQVLGTITAPLTNMLALLNAPLQNLVGLIEARIEQLGGLDSAPAAVAEEAAAAISEPAGAEEPGGSDEAAEQPDESEGSAAAAPSAEAPAVETGEESAQESDDQEVSDGGG